jgi:hypothetical protein
VEAVAAEHGRTIDPEHFGVLVPYAMTELPAAFLAGIAQRRPDLTDPSAIVPLGWEALAAQIGRFVDVGFSKFVVVPLEEPPTAQAWTAHLEEAAERLLPLQT